MTLPHLLQIIVSLGLLNVWLIRAPKETSYRGGEAKNLRQEFATYGLPVWFYYLIGVLKVGSALALLYGLWNSAVALFASFVVVGLMIGAIAMHLKVKDPFIKSLPALLMLAMSAAVVFFQLT